MSGHGALARVPADVCVMLPQNGPNGYPARSRPSSAGLAGRSRGGRLPAEMEQMVMIIDSRVTHATQAEDSRVRMMQDQVVRLEEGLQALRAAREVNEERKLKESRMVEGNFMMELGKIQQARSELEAKSEEASNAKLAEFREDLQRTQEKHVTSCADLTRQVGDDVKRITAMLEEQRAARTDYGERIVVSLEGEFQKVHDAVVAEQKLRFEAEGTMLRMVEDICSRMRGEIQQERSEREAVQGKLLGLLEDTCNRIESSIHPGDPGFFQGPGIRR